jgi:hypothetical protein
VDQNKVIISVFLDLKRAFETIDRQILLQKLLCCGITKIEYEWFKSYLNLRFQQTRFNGVLFAFREVQLGVPQGSVIGSLLFILYMNDIVKAISHSQINLFADDTLLSVSVSTVAECIEKMQEDLDALSDWLKFNKLKLNVSKTKFMIITGKRSSATERALLTIDGEQIEEVQSMKYFGVQIDNELAFK